jgi:hypothetical protein
MEPISAHSSSWRRVCEMGGTTIWQISMDKQTIFLNKCNYLSSLSKAFWILYEAVYIWLMCILWFNTSQACRNTFQEWSWKIKYFIWFRHKNPMVNNNLNLPKGFMNSMNSKAIAILFLGINQFATSMSKAIQLAYLSSSIYDLL